GARQAVLDPVVVPRDGSVSISVVLFDGAAKVAVQSTEVRNDDDAQALADQLELLRCASLNSFVEPCPSGDTNLDAAIRKASEILRVRTASRRVFMLLTDGQGTDQDMGRKAAAQASEDAAADGVDAELDVALVGLDAQEVQETIQKISGV